MLAKDERMEVIEMIKDALEIVLERQDKKMKSYVRDVVKEVMDYQTDRFLKIFDSQQKMVERHDEWIKGQDNRNDVLDGILKDQDKRNEWLERFMKDQSKKNEWMDRMIEQQDERLKDNKKMIEQQDEGLKDNKKMLKRLEDLARGHKSKLDGMKDALKDENEEDTNK